MISIYACPFHWKLLMPTYWNAPSPPPLRQYLEGYRNNDCDSETWIHHMPNTDDNTQIIPTDSNMAPHKSWAYEVGHCVGHCGLVCAESNQCGL